MKSLLIALALVLLSSSAGVEASGKGPKPEVLGISIGMSREAVRKKLARIGRLEKEERKQQEVWSLNGDGPYESVIVGFDKGYTGVRYVTARAREGGRRVRYADVLDTSKAMQEGTVSNLKYVQRVAPSGGRPGYVLTARGTDPVYLSYFSVEKVD